MISIWDKLLLSDLVILGLFAIRALSPDCPPWVLHGVQVCILIDALIILIRLWI